MFELVICVGCCVVFVASFVQFVFTACVLCSLNLGTLFAYADGMFELLIGL